MTQTPKDISNGFTSVSKIPRKMSSTSSAYVTLPNHFHYSSRACKSKCLAKSTSMPISWLWNKKSPYSKLWTQNSRHRKSQTYLMQPNFTWPREWLKSNGNWLAQRSNTQSQNLREVAGTFQGQPILTTRKSLMSIKTTSSYKQIHFSKAIAAWLTNPSLRISVNSILENVTSIRWILKLTLNTTMIQYI